MKQNKSIDTTLLAAALVLLTVFTIDLLIPLGISMGVMYLFSLFLVVSKNKTTILWFASLATVLTITKLLLFQNISTNYMPFVNRGLTVIVLWLMAFLAIRYRRLVEKRQSDRANYTKELEQMLYMTNHQIRQPITNCLGLIDVLDYKNPSKEELMRIYIHLKTSAMNLDAFSKELNQFLSEKTKGYQVGNK